MATTQQTIRPTRDEAHTALLGDGWEHHSSLADGEMWTRGEVHCVIWFTDDRLDDTFLIRFRRDDNGRLVPIYGER